MYFSALSRYHSQNSQDPSKQNNKVEGILAEEFLPLFQHDLASAKHYHWATRGVIGTLTHAG